MEGKELQNVSEIVEFVNKQIRNANQAGKTAAQIAASSARAAHGIINSESIKETTDTSSNNENFIKNSMSASLGGVGTGAEISKIEDGSSASNEDLLFPENYAEELVETNNYFSAAESDLGTSLSYANNAVMEYESLINDESKSGLQITETRDQVSDLLEECTSFFISFSIVAQSFIAAADEILRKIYDNDLLAKVGTTNINSLTIEQENELIKYLADLGVKEAKNVLKKGAKMGLKEMIDATVDGVTSNVVKELLESLGDDAITLVSGSIPLSVIKYSIYKYLEFKSGILNQTGALVADDTLSDVLSELSEEVAKTNFETAAKFYKGTISFVVSAATSFIMSRINSDKTFSEDLTRALGISALSIASEAAATAIVTAVGAKLGFAVAGPVGAVAVVALGTLIEYVFTPVVDYIIQGIFYYDEGIPKTYKPMTNEELIEAMKEGKFAKELEDGTLVYRFAPESEKILSYEGSTADYIAHLKDLGIDDNTIAYMMIGNKDYNAQCLDVLFGENGAPLDVARAVIDFTTSYEYITTCTDEQLRELAESSGVENIDAYYEQLLTLREVFSPENIDSNPELADILNSIYRNYWPLNQNLYEAYEASQE